VAGNAEIIGFFSGERPDREGRYLRDIQEWPDGPLESIHDFIQWMFPLTEPSPVNPAAPVLDADTIAVIRADSALQSALRVSWLRLLDFYGLEIRGQRVECGRDFGIKSQNWLHPGNHNHLRITRILKCQRLLGLQQEALAFFACLKNIYDLERAKTTAGITKRTFRFWEDAAGATRTT
jgi:hypothetical protein